MRQRSHDALRARARGLAAWTGPGPAGLLDLPETAWTPMLRDLGARLVAPAPGRPYWSVYRADTYLAAAREPRRAILRAAFAALAPPGPRTP